MLMPPVIAFDLDGTLAQDYGDEFDPMLIGEPRPEIVSILRTLKAVGCVVVLYTVRGPESYPAIVEWLTRNDIPWDGINENPLFGQNLESKMMFDVLIDDRAVNSRTPEGVILQSVITQIDPMFGEMIRQEMMSQRTSRYGFLMAPLAGRMADEIRPLQKLIDPADLAGDGLVRDLHITILANIMDRDRDSIARVMSSVARAPFRMAKGVTVFDEVSPGVSALVVEIQGDAVPVLHEVAARSFSHLETFKTYRPHVTLGYVKSEAVDRYVTMQIPNIGSTVETLSFVAPGEPELIIPLRG
jgi:2'-5' RNA ligase